MMLVSVNADDDENGLDGREGVDNSYVSTADD